jgi:D-amino-acid dehydrogenase
MTNLLETSRESAALSRRKTDVVIVGAGVAGLCSAYHLAKAGRSVRIVDQAQPGAGSSFGNCGMISPSHVLPNTLPGLPWKAFKWMFQKSAPFRVVPQANMDFVSWMFGFWQRCSAAQVKRTAPAIGAILASSRTLFHEMISSENMQLDYAQDGCIYVYSTPAAFAAEGAWRPVYDECGVQVNIHDAQSLLKLEPALKAVVHGGYHFPNDATLRPDRYVEELVRVLTAMGVEINSQVTVQHLAEDSSGVTLTTSAGAIVASEAILAAGSWSPLVSKALGFRIPIQPGKGYSITMGRPERCPKHSMVLKEKSVAVTPWSSGFRLGSTMEFVGYDTSLNPTRIQALIDGAAAFLHTPTGPGERTPWYGWRPMTMDTVPIIDRAPKHKKLWLATGHSMLGVSMSTATGKLVAELMTGAKPHIDPDPYRYSRF